MVIIEILVGVGALVVIYAIWLGFKQIMTAIRNSKKNKRFTLIELLVIIAIIGILSSVVVASFNTAREKGRALQQKEQGQIPVTYSDR